MQEPVRIKGPVRWPSLDHGRINLTMRHPSVALIHFCSRIESPPNQVHRHFQSTHKVSHALRRYLRDAVLLKVSSVHVTALPFSFNSYISCYNYNVLYSDAHPYHSIRWHWPSYMCRRHTCKSVDIYNVCIDVVGFLKFCSQILAASEKSVFDLPRDYQYFQWLFINTNGL